MNELVLASKSPRRRELMKLLGHPFKCMIPNVEENYIANETPEDHVIRLSALKALDVGKKYEHGIVIGSDTIVVIDNRILGKPNSSAEAEAMIMRLQGRTHTVYTGYTLYNAKNEQRQSGCELSEVTMCELSPERAWKYIATNEPMDKAGAYGIQGYGSVLITSIKGCFFNVMGLPLSKIMRELNVFSDGRFGYFGTIAEMVE